LNHSCKIVLCIVYTVLFEGILSKDHAFQELPGNIHTLRTELAPIGESDIRAFLEQFTEEPTPPFNLSIKYRQNWDMPQDLIEVAYRPPHPRTSESTHTPMEGIVEFHADHERLESLYLRAQDRQYTVYRFARRQAVGTLE
jgi:hypothetical protein